MLKKIGYVLNRKQKLQLAMLLIIIFIGAFVEMLGVSAILPIVNIALKPESVEETWYLVWIRDTLGLYDVKQLLMFMAIVMIVIYIIKNIYIMFMYSEQYRFTFNNQRKLAVQMLNCYMQQEYLFHVSKNVAELQRNVTADVNGFFTVLLNTLQLIAEVSVCVLVSLFLANTDLMTTIMLAVLMVVFIAVFAGIFKKVLVKKGEENRVANMHVTKWILQSFSGIKEIKVIDAEDFFISNYDKHYKKCATLQRQQSVMTIMPRPIMETVCICGLLLTVIIKLQISQTEITDLIPTLTAFAMAAFRLLPAFNRITGYLSGIMFNKPSIDAVYKDLLEIEELTKKKKEVSNENVKLNLSDAIKLEKICFKYPENDKWILKDADLEIEKNTSVAFVGSSGAGKTTVADLILGLFEPQGGKITVNGIDIRANMPAWHENIGYIPQNIYLIDDTIRANITFGIVEEEIDEERIRKALKEAQLDEFVNSLPEGLNTVIGDRGVKLSGGQRQRIGIARALYRNPDVLILDEATSALDNETEREVMAAIDGLHGTRTLIVIAHRLSTIKKCDRIYEIGEGKIKLRSKEEVFE